MHRSDSFDTHGSSARPASYSSANSSHGIRVDSGKTLHPGELSASGAAHEAAGGADRLERSA
jgi:hypothetical protein